MKDLYNENLKTMMKEIEEDTKNTWKQMTMKTQQPKIYGLQQKQI